MDHTAGGALGSWELGRNRARRGASSHPLQLRRPQTATQTRVRRGQSWRAWRTGCSGRQGLTIRARGTGLHRATGDGRMRGASGTSSVERAISPPAESSQPGNFLAGAVIELGEGALGASSSESRRGRKAIWTHVPAGPLARCQTQIIGVSIRSIGPDGDSPWRCRPALSSLTLCLRTRRGRRPPSESCLPRFPPRLALDSSTLSHVPDTCRASHTPSIQLRQS